MLFLGTAALFAAACYFLKACYHMAMASRLLMLACHCPRSCRLQGFVEGKADRKLRLVSDPQPALHTAPVRHVLAHGVCLQEEEVQFLRMVVARLRTQLGDGQYPALPCPSSALPALL
jgi:hypothetical protein